MKPPVDLMRFGLIAGATAGALIGHTLIDPQYRRNFRPNFLFKQATNATRDNLTPTSSDIPNRVPYLLVGGGTASYYAALTIRARDPEAKVLIIGDEPETPYSRTQMSKELLWYGDENVATTLQYRSIQGRPKELHYEVEGFYVKPSEWKTFEHGCISVINGKKVWKVDAAKKTATLESGEKIKFDKCLIATGTRAKTLDELNKTELKDRVHTLRTIEDFRRIDAALRSSKSIAIIGEGILASELSYSIQRRYRKTGEPKIVQIFEEDDVLQQILPSRLREDASKQMFKMGVRLLNNSTIQSAAAKPDGGIQLAVQQSDGRKEEVAVDHVIVAIGAEPSAELAHTSDLKIDPKNGGILVDEEFCAASDVFSAGDVSSFNDLKLGRRRIEHVEHAEISGRVAGENMSGGKRTYPRQASWRSAVSPDVHFIGLGKVDSSMKTVVVAAQKDEEIDDELRAVAFYVEDEKIVGIVLYNVFEDGVLIARKLLEDGVKASQIPDVARLFHLYPSEKGEEKEEEEEEEEEEDG